MELLKELGLDKLTPFELEEVIKHLQDLLNIKQTSTITHGQVKEIKYVPVCPHCEGKHVVKNGHDNGVQRYRCRECGKSFVASTNTIFHSTKLSYDQWFTFIKCELLHLTLEASAQEIGVSVTTAFSMRHKLHDALSFLKKN